jgi:hypothetical protein
MKMNLRLYIVVFSLLVGVFTLVHYAESALQRHALPSAAQTEVHLPQPPQLTLQQNLVEPATNNLGMPERRVSAASR